MMQPLSGIKVVDFSTLLPGPICTLLLAEAGADVIKIEKPAGGDEMRSYSPKAGPDSVNFGLLNRGKRSTAIDLKSTQGRDSVLALIAEADVLVEQFRPGVMERLGLGFEKLSELNPKLIYCSITGYGQTGDKADKAAHDLNYLAETGLLGLSRGSGGAPVLPPVLVADIAGGAYPALMNILLALRQRDVDGRGRHLDVSMADNLFTFMYWGLGAGFTGSGWPKPAAELVTGGTARYQIYRTADAQYLAAAPLEDKFWHNFAIALDAPDLELYEDGVPLIARVASIIEQKSAAFWLDRFSNLDVCTVRVVSLDEAVADPHFGQRDLFSRRVRLSDGTTIPALPVPIDGQFRSSLEILDAPQLGAHTSVVFGSRAGGEQ